MLAISESSLAALGQRADRSYVARLRGWIGERPELEATRAVATPTWCEQLLRSARGCGISSEDDVARFARLCLLRGDDWLRSSAAQDILASERDGQLKTFQLECLHWGIANG